MRCKKRLMIALLVIGLIVAAALPSVAAKPQEKRRIVSVVYDTSWSMSKSSGFSGDISKATSSRWLYARYALQMLMSLLGENDSLVITSMTPTEPGGEEYPHVEIDLAQADRNTEIHEKLPNPKSDDEKRAAIETSIFFQENLEGTPGSSIGAAVRRLIGERGLKSKDELQDADPNLEHWLVIFTDGAFDGVNSPSDADREIERYIDEYPSLNVIYLGFKEDGDRVFDLSKGDLTKKYKFFSYLAEGADSLVGAMQDIANRLTGRYELNKNAYTIDGATVTIDLSTVAYSFKSVSIMAQNCGASLLGASYNDGNTAISQNCTIIPPDGLDDLRSGCSAVIKGNPYFSGGKLVLTFDQPIEDISILAEPYIILSHYYEYKENGEWKRVDMQYINSHLTDTDKIRVGYETQDGNTGKSFDLKEMFGKVETKVTYAGNSYKCGDEFPLTIGKNEVGVSVSALGGKYTLYSSEVCIIESNPLDYQVSHEGDCPKTVSSAGTAPTLQSVYSVYRGGKPLTDKAALAPYTLQVAVTDADGNVLTDTAALNNNGTITINTTIPFAAYGEYTEWIKITDPDKLSREHSHTVAYVPSSIKIAMTAGTGYTLTETQLAKNRDKTFSFTLSSDGAPLDFDGGLLDYTLTVAGKDVTQYAIRFGNTLTYTPNAETLGEVPLLAGDMEVKLSANLTEYPDVRDEAGTVMQITPSSYTLEAVASPNKSVDRFALDENTAVLYFRLLRDNEPLTAPELQNLYDAGEITVKDKGTFSSYFWLPCGREAAADTVDGAGVIAVRVNRDWINPFQTFVAMLILNGEKPVSVNVFGLEASDAFTFTPSGIWSYIWRILIILLIVHLTLFVIGFFLSKSFPSGTLVRIDLGSDNRSPISYSCTSINIAFMDKWFWHYRRLLFILPFNGNQPSKDIYPIKLAFLKGIESAQMTFKEEMWEISINPPSNAAGNAFEAFVGTFSDKKYAGEQPMEPDEALTSGALRKMCKKVPNGAIVPDENNHTTLGGTYGIFDSSKGILESIILFIKKQKN